MTDLSLQKLYQELTGKLSSQNDEEAGVCCIANPKQEARTILAHRLGASWSDIVLDRAEYGFAMAKRVLIDEDVRKRLSGVPLSRIYGQNHFFGLDFTINEATLDPRLDSEVLVDLVRKCLDKTVIKKKNSASSSTQEIGSLGHEVDSVSILDLGTGSGCLLITLLSLFPKAHGIGVDLSAKALDAAQENAISHGVVDRCHFVCGSWAESLQGQFDVVLSNPPYIASDVVRLLDSDVVNHDPILALDGGEDGLQEYKNIFSMLSRLLKKDGYAFFEIGYDQGESASRLVEKYGFSVNAVHKDLNGKPRVLEVSKDSSGDK